MIYHKITNKNDGRVVKIKTMCLVFKSIGWETCWNYIFSASTLVSIFIRQLKNGLILQIFEKSYENVTWLLIYKKC